MYIHGYAYNVHTYVCMYVPYILLKALPPVCMKYTAQGESRLANIAQGEAECYILPQYSHQELYTFIQTK